MGASLIRSVHAPTSDLVTGLDARRQIGRTATTTADHAATLRRVHCDVSQTPNCLDEARWPVRGRNLSTTPAGDRPTAFGVLPAPAATTARALRCAQRALPGVGL
jgi:hypothetical protein